MEKLSTKLFKIHIQYHDLHTQELNHHYHLHHLHTRQAYIITRSFLSRISDKIVKKFRKATYHKDTF